MLKINETWINKTKNYMIGESGYYEPYTDNLGELFQSLQKEYGRCVSKVYQDNIDGASFPCGWVFEKKIQYDNCNEYYISNVWVVYKHALDN